LDGAELSLGYGEAAGSTAVGRLNKSLLRD